MNLELTPKQFRRLLDLVYIGNWILNSTRGDQRFEDYDQVESLVFARRAAADTRTDGRRSPSLGQHADRQHAGTPKPQRSTRAGRA